MRTKATLVVISILVSLSLVACRHHEHEHDKDHKEAEGIILISNTQDTIMHVFQGQGIDTISLDSNQILTMQVWFLDAEGHAFQPEEAKYSLGWTIDEPAVVELLTVENQKWEFNLQALTQGNTNLRLHILHGTHEDFSSPPLPVIIQP